MNLTPSDNLPSEYRDKEEELLEYKLEEVKSDWVNDFGEISEEVLNEIYDMVTDPNEERIPILEKTVRTLRRNLISKNLVSITTKISKYETSTVDFSDVMIVVKSLEKQLSAPLGINELNAIYKDVLQPLKYKLISRAKIVDNKKRNTMLLIACSILIATFFYLLGHYT